MSKPITAADVDEGLAGALRGIRLARDRITLGNVAEADSLLASVEYVLDVVLNGAAAGPEPEGDVEEQAERGVAP